MKSTPIAIAAVTVLLSLSAQTANAQPFFGGGAGIFDPEISVVQSGVIFDAQATVSADRKYVTLTTRLQNAQLLSLSEFAFQTGGPVPPGQVGGGGGGGVAGGAGAGNVVGQGAAGAEGRTGFGARTDGSEARQSHHPLPRKSYPAPGKAKASEAGKPSVLDKEGMTLVGRVRGPSES